MKIKIILLLLLNSISAFLLAQDSSLIFSKSYGRDRDPAIIFLHGGPGYNSVSFELSTAQTIADKGYFVIIFDQRGCARSKGIKNSKYTFEEAFSDINSIYEKYKIKSATLIGHSWGGILGTKYTEKFPDKVNRLVLVDAPVSLQKTFKTILATCRKIYEEKDTSNLQYIRMIEKMDTTSLKYSSSCFYNAMLNRNYFYSPKNPSEESKEILKKIMGSKDAKYIADMAMEPVSGFSQNENYTSIDLTTTLKKLTATKKIYGIYGSEDGLYDAEQLNSIRSIIGTSNFKMIVNAAHNVFIDQQTEFINQLITFTTQN